MKFKSVMRVLLREGDAPFELSSDEEIISWIESQAASWDSHLSSINEEASKLPNAQSWLSEHVNAWRNQANEIRNRIATIPDEAKEAEMLGYMQRIQDALRSGTLIWAGSDVAQRIFALVEVDKDASLWILLAARGHSRWYLVDNNNPIFWQSFTNAVVHLQDPKLASSFWKKQRAAIGEMEKLVAGVSEKHGEIEIQQETQKNSFEFEMKGFTEKIDGLVSDSARAAKDQRDLFDDEWKRLRSAYDRDLKLRAPREYWGSKFKEHGLVASRWRNAFFASAACAVALIAGSLILLSSGFIGIPAELTSYRWVIPAVMLGVPAFISLWVLRLFGRQWSDHLLRREDARERVVMVETFLAISRDTDSPGAVADPAQLGIVLSSIFRSGPGMITDDSPPAGFFEVLMARAASGQGKAP